MNKTNIEYLDYTWNPTKGCSKGCRNCWAKAMAKRLAGMGVQGYDPNNPFKARCFPERLDEPFKIKYPSRIGISFMGDLFDPEIPFEFVDEAIKSIYRNKRHQFLILTKRSNRMAEYFKQLYHSHSAIPNLWLGVSCENQQTVDERIPILLQIPAAVRFVSIEPMLGEVSLVEHQPFRNKKYGNNLSGIWGLLNPLHWVIVGCESGHNRRECKLEWVANIVGQCKSADVPVFVKQLNAGGLLLKNMDEWPEPLRIREYPK